MADIAAEVEEGGLKRTLKDLFAGAAGGIAQVLLGELGYLPGVNPATFLMLFKFVLSSAFSKWGVLTSCPGQQQ